MRLPSPVFAVFPLLVLLNGASPYLGLKTRGCWAMFSNVRTELRWEGDESNHFLVPSSLKIAGFQEDLVRVVKSSDPKLADLAERGDHRPFFEFRRYISTQASWGITDLQVTYIRGGVKRSVANAENDPELSKPYPYLMSKLLIFGDVSAGPRQRNRH
jgi:hypothetical protein